MSSGRLSVELRVLALLALLALLYFGQCLAWALFLIDGPTLHARLVEDPALLAALIAAPGVALLITLIHVALRMPSVRWPRAPGPRPLPLLLLGAPALLLWPWLWIRDRRAGAISLGTPQGGDRSSDEIEIGFRALLDLPRLAGIGFGLWNGGAAALIGVALTRALPLDPRLAFELLGLWLALLLPLIVIAVSRTRAMLVPEYLAAPRPIAAALPRRRSLRLRLGTPAALVVIGVVLAPILATLAWSEQHEQLLAREQARAQAEQLAGFARRGNDLALGEFLAEHPDSTVELAGRRYGTPVRLADPSASGMTHASTGASGSSLLWVHRESTSRGKLVAITRVATPDPPSLWQLVLIAVLGLGAGLGALIPLVRDVDRDLGRVSRQVATVADGRVPESLALASFATRELRDLVAAVDRLVGRITDANVTKYVMIERAREVDRLKSQFLANMSHDLRSPLNSVLGFSELLQTGIEGDLADDQRDMVRAIHRSGKQLLQQIDDILDTAKIEAGRVDLHREPTPPATLISRAIQRARARLVAIEFETTTAAGLPSAFVDPYRTVQALENVLVFIGELLERGTLDIRCSMERDENGTGEVVIRITSPRVPTSPEQLAHARRGFSRLPGTTGLGLGLPIATSLLELQGGSLRVHHESSSPDDSTKRIALRVNPNARVDVAMAFELRLPALFARRGVRLRMSDAMSSLADRSDDHQT
jgi:signal transduction histidine kinase